MGKAAVVLALGAVTVLGGAGCQTGEAPAASSDAPAVVYVERSTGWQPVDWTGKAGGLIGSEHVGLPYQSPDGSRVAWQPEGDWEVVDRKGKVLSHLDLSRSRSIAWADDSSGLCLIRQLSDTQAPGAGAYVLDFVSATSGQSATIASFTMGMGPDIAACSPTAARVVVVSASGYKDATTMQQVITFGELRVIDFKTGTVAFRQVFPAGGSSATVRSVVVSHDGAAAAVESDNQTTIEDLADGRVARTLGRLQPLSFSWDAAHLAVTDRRSANRGEIIDLASGQPSWTDSVPGRVTQGAAAKPGAGDLMLFTTTGELTDLVVVSASGASSRTIAHEVFTAQVGPCPTCSAF